MNIKDELLNRYKAEYAKIKDADNIDELFDKEMRDLFSSPRNFHFAEDYGRALAIAAAKLEQMCKADPANADLVKGVAQSIASYSDFDAKQLHKALFFRNQLDQIEKIKEFGELTAYDEEISAQSDAIDREYPQEETEQSQEYDENEIEIVQSEPEFSEFDEKSKFDAIYNAHAVAHDLSDPDKCVCMDYQLMNKLLEDKDLIQTRIRDRDFLYGDLVDDELNLSAAPKDADPREVANADAVTRLGVYMTLDRRSKERSFLDVLKHPINSFKEWRAKKSLENDLNKKYGLSKNALSNMEKMILDTKHKTGKDGNEKVDKDFVFMAKDGQIVSVNSHTEKEINALAERDFPKDKNFDAIIQAREEERKRQEQQTNLDLSLEEEDLSAMLREDTDLEKRQECEKSHFMLTGEELTNGEMTKNETSQKLE